MKGKILLVVGLGVGYVLGSRAGREKYDELVAKVQKVWNDPRVQKQATNVGDFVKEKAPDVADFLATNVKKATNRSSTARRGATRTTTSRSTTAKPATGKSPSAGTTTSKS